MLLFQSINYTFIFSLTDLELEISSWVGYGFIIFQVLMILGCNFFFNKSKNFRQLMKKMLFLKTNRDDQHEGSDLLFRRVKT